MLLTAPSIYVLTLSPLVYKRFWLAQCAGSRTDGMPTVDQSDMRGLGTA